MIYPTVAYRNPAEAPVRRGFKLWSFAPSVLATAWHYWLAGIPAPREIPPMLEPELVPDKERKLTSARIRNLAQDVKSTRLSAFR